MYDFQVGQKVICIQTPDKKLGYGDEILPLAGNIYTIRDIYILRGRPAYFLVEIVNLVRCEDAWPGRYFRPIRKTDISIFEKMLTAYC